MLRKGAWKPCLEKGNISSVRMIVDNDLRLNESEMCVGVLEVDAAIICPKRFVNKRIGRLPCPNCEVTAEPLTTPINE